MKRLARMIVILALIIYGPLIYQRVTTPILPADQAKPADAVLVFGALVRNGQISALHAERLDTSKALLDQGKVQTIVVSNAARAAEFMRDYLVANGVPAASIEVDPNAPATPDTCVAELARPSPRDVILLSQSFHLPRIALQCANLGLTGQYVAATSAPQTGQTGTIATLWIRVRRHSREALLIWAELLGLYRALN